MTKTPTEVLRDLKKHKGPHVPWLATMILEYTLPESIGNFDKALERLGEIRAAIISVTRAMIDEMDKGQGHLYHLVDDAHVGPFLSLAEAVKAQGQGCDDLGCVSKIVRTDRKHVTGQPGTFAELLKRAAEYVGDHLDIDEQRRRTRDQLLHMANEAEKGADGPLRDIVVPALASPAAAPKAASFRHQLGSMKLAELIDNLAKDLTLGGPADDARGDWIGELSARAADLRKQSKATVISIQATKALVDVLKKEPTRSLVVRLAEVLGRSEFKNIMTAVHDGWFKALDTFAKRLPADDLVNDDDEADDETDVVNALNAPWGAGMDGPECCAKMIPHDGPCAVGCNREAGHTGFHIARGHDRVLAIWGKWDTEYNRVDDK